MFKLNIFCLMSLLLAGCTPARHTGSPADNAAINTVSPARNQGGGALQKSFDTWEEEEWIPAMEAREANNSRTAASPEEESNDTWGLQPYAEKLKHYNKLKAQEESGPSHVEKVNGMPVIGK